VKPQESRKIIGVKTNTFLDERYGNKSNSQCKDGQDIYHMIKYQLSKDKRHLELFMVVFYT
jgi:hypothetical protein